MRRRSATRMRPQVAQGPANEKGVVREEAERTITGGAEQATNTSGVVAVINLEGERPVTDLTAVASSAEELEVLLPCQVVAVLQVVVLPVGMTHP